MDGCGAEARTGVKLYLACIGVKGDWAFARKAAWLVLFAFSKPEAFHLETGWMSKRICHLCTAESWHDPTDAAPWTTSGPGPSPFKPGPPSPFLDVPGAGGADGLLVDYLHCFHLGYGIDLAASTVVLLAQDRFFGYQRAFDDSLAAGYATFMKWCHENQRQTNIKEFSKLKFDMESNLGWLLFPCNESIVPGTLPSQPAWEERP